LTQGDVGVQGDTVVDDSSPVPTQKKRQFQPEGAERPGLVLFAG
jgi:hypothetical protein